MGTSADVSILRIFPFHVACWILLKPVIGGVNGLIEMSLQQFEFHCFWHSLGIRFFSLF
jgi:hypothetical protein